MSRFAPRHRWPWAALLMALATTLAIGMPANVAAASEAGQDDEVGANLLREFTVINLTNRDMTFHGWETMRVWAGTWFDDLPAPAVGESWDPGRKNVFSLTYRPFALNGARMTYSIGGSIVRFDATVDTVNTPATQCVWTNPDVACRADGDTVILTSTTPSSRVVGPDDRQRQYDTLHALCDTQAYTAATCSYRPIGTGVKMVAGEPRYLTETHHVNCRASGEDVLDHRLQREVGGSTALSVAGEISLNIAQVVTVGVTVTQMQTVTWNQVVLVNHSLKVPPSHVGWFDYYPAVLRVNGEFLIRIGDDRIVISDVWTETMITDPAIKGVIVSRNSPISADAFERLCTTPPPPLP